MISPQQRLYAQHRADGMKKKAAAIAAGCSEKTASQQAARYEKNPKVLAHMERLGFYPGEEVKAEMTGKKKPRAKKKAAPVAELKKDFAEFNASRPAVTEVPPVRQGEFKCPLDYFNHVMNDAIEDPKIRLDAAKALASYKIAKPGDKGKKEERQEAADKLANSGRFGTAPPPLKAVK